ncbi:MAG: hypothetical protein C0498_04920 [Anaerolinea sp.]|nr:hypothetical protein [Anaerolinea sp.]
MTAPPPRVSGARAVAPAVLLLVVLALTAPWPTSAETVGDLYATTSGGVLELHVASGKVITRVDVATSPSAAAFSNSGRSLYLASGLPQIGRIDIEVIELADSITLPINVAAVAVPLGQTAVTAGPARARLLLADLENGTISESERLPAAPDLLAADRRDPYAIAARSGSAWVAILDVGARTVSRLNLKGAVVGLAVDRAGGAGFVVTRSPNRVARIRFDDPAVLWSVPLPEQPTAVTSTSFGPIVSGSDELWATDGRTLAVWANQGTPTGILTASDDGSIVYLGTPDRVLAFDRTAGLRQSIRLQGSDRVLGLAAFPAPSSLSAGAGLASAGSARGASSARPPATSTLPDRSRASTEGSIPAGGAVVIFVIVLAAGLIVIRRLAPPD